MEESSSLLPLYSRRPGARQSRRETSPVQKCIHVIPVILFFTLFILWWFSYPVNLVFKDGRIVEIVPTEILNDMLLPAALNDTNVELAILQLASALSQIVSTPLNLTRNNETESILISKSD
ncbi:hypothetical protein LWI29_035796 [Acer saccharum]|uniref:Uncharacterized protein n=1 Tax=Acer saccharum TaxID=4024 RepID=A0AA39TKG3_ACESA|nr:hypothetical protein LWI29_035796 [Acer saccharum]KAK1587494.1 hypothetical protein Q3G72_013542 [Acer saccharum]